MGRWQPVPVKKTGEGGCRVGAVDPEAAEARRWGLDLGAGSPSEGAAEARPWQAYSRRSKPHTMAPSPKPRWWPLRKECTLKAADIEPKKKPMS